MMSDASETSLLKTAIQCPSPAWVYSVKDDTAILSMSLDPGLQPT
jgi:hypothetical protein